MTTGQTRKFPGKNAFPLEKKEISLESLDFLGYPLSPGGETNGETIKPQLTRKNGNRAKHENDNKKLKKFKKSKVKNCFNSI